MVTTFADAAGAQAQKLQDLREQFKLALKDAGVEEYDLLAGQLVSMAKVTLA